MVAQVERVKGASNQLERARHIGESLYARRVETVADWVIGRGMTPLMEY